MDSHQKFGLTRRQFVSSSAATLAMGALAPNAFASQQSTRNQPPSGSTPARVIIDTDPGVDDAFALLLAMRSPELKIEGITAVAGNVPLELTLPNALRMVEIAGRTDYPGGGRSEASVISSAGDGDLRAWRKRIRRRRFS